MITLFRAILIWILGNLIIFIFGIDYNFTFVISLAISAVITILKILL